MTFEDIQDVEQQLDVTFPIEYIEFLTSLPEDDQSELDLAFACVYHTSQGLLAANAKIRERCRMSGKRWPETMVAIGNDGSGNEFCFDSAVDSPPLLMFEPDVDNGFVEEFESLSEFVSSVNVMSQFVADEQDEDALDADENDETEDADDDELDAELTTVQVTRGKAGRKGVEAISLEEWRSYAESDPEIELTDCREAINPFTNETTRVDAPGGAKWNGRWIGFHFGVIELPGGDAQCLSKARQIAEALGAKVEVD